MLLPRGEQTGASCRGAMEAAPGRSTSRLAGGEACRQLFGRLHGGLCYGAFVAIQPIFLRTFPKGLSEPLPLPCLESVTAVSVAMVCGPCGEIRHGRDELTLGKCI